MDRKRIVSCLAALSILFSQGMYFPKIKAETKTPTSAEQSADSYEVLPIKTMFNATEKELDKEIFFNANIVFTKISINGELIIIPLEKNY